jgi:hypothetical protein
MSRQDPETGFQPVENGCSVRTQGLLETELPAGKMSRAISLASAMSVYVQNRQDQLRGMFRVVVDRVGADLVRSIKVEE